MPTESSLPYIVIPDSDLWAFLFERNDRPYPDDKVIYRDADTGRSYTYAEVKKTAIEFGTGLKAVWDWKKGHVLAFFTPNSVDTPAVTLGCHWAGGIPSPANPAYTANELAFQLKNAGAKALVTQTPLLPVALEAAKQAGIPHDRIILLGDERDPSMKFKHFTSIRSTSGASRYRRTKLKPCDDLAFLVYSSGTTGLPKGVMISHENVVSNTLMHVVGEGGHLTWNGGANGQGDNILAFLPFYHIYGLASLVIQGLYSGLTITVMSKFDFERVCSVIQNHRITFIYLVPPVVLLFGKHPAVDKYDLSSLRMLSCGAAPLTQELVKTVYGRIKVPIKQGYGLSETSPTSHSQSWENWDKPIGAVGRLLSNQTAKYMDSSETEVPAGQTGELWIKGPNIFKGYHNNPEATKAVLTEDGYFKTGDVGYQDANGIFFITDRVKELIKYKGFQVAPAELEGLLISHPLVDDVAVIGLYDHSQATEVPRAYVVHRPVAFGEEKTSEREIAEWVAARVAPHKRLRGGVRFVDAVPKSPSGKILRRLLKVQAEEEEKKREPEIKAKL